MQHATELVGVRFIQLEGKGCARFVHMIGHLGSFHAANILPGKRGWNHQPKRYDFAQCAARQLTRHTRLMFKWILIHHPDRLANMYGLFFRTVFGSYHSPYIMVVVIVVNKKRLAAGCGMGRKNVPAASSMLPVHSFIWMEKRISMFPTSVTEAEMTGEFTNPYLSITTLRDILKYHAIIDVEKKVFLHTSSFPTQHIAWRHIPEFTDQ